jgi:hypothetical protein
VPDVPQAEPEKVRVYWVRLRSGRTLLALKVEKGKRLTAVSLPRGIRARFSSGEVLEVVADRVPASELRGQVKDMKRRMEEAKRREKLNKILRTRR